MAWGEGQRAPPLTTPKLASLADFCSFFPQCGAWFQTIKGLISGSIDSEELKIATFKLLAILLEVTDASRDVIPQED